MTAAGTELPIPNVRSSVANGVPAQVVDATQALNRSAGVANPSGQDMLNASSSHFEPTRTSAVLADGYQVVKSFRYLLTDPRQSDIL
jgi:hypothetical protein